MAITYPQELLDADVKSPAERRLFTALRTQLSEEWLVFHSASLVLRDHAEGAADDECDFVLSHPRHGIVCLEVKGGPLECRHGEWRRDGERIKDPFGQAIDHAHNVRRKLEEARGVRHPSLHVVQALAFPDLTIHQLVLAPDAPRQILWDRHDVEDLAAALERTIAFHHGSRDKRVAPDPDLVRRTLAPEVEIRVPMAARFVEEEAELIRLTHEQAGLIARHWRTPRMAVHGCAGSGKTMLAVERARRLAREGQDVLFVCFNKQLGSHLRQRERQDRISYFTFHALCTHLARRAGVELPAYPDGAAPQEYFRFDLPAALLEAVDRDGPCYDALIVDEAQDLNRDWLDALTATLRDPAAGSVWLFLDDNQRVYDADLEVPGGYMHYDLTVNCRNTRAIHEEVMAHYDGSIEFDVRGPAGRPVFRHPVADQGAALAETLTFLVDREEVLPQDIVVLSSHPLDRSAVGQRANGRFTLTPERGKPGARVHFSSIRAFKGLESPVVVLVETEDLDPNTRAQQLYVAISRARNHCVILEPA